MNKFYTFRNCAGICFFVVFFYVQFPFNKTSPVEFALYLKISLSILTLLHSNVHACFPAPSKRKGTGNQAKAFECRKEMRNKKRHLNAKGFMSFYLALAASFNVVSTYCKM